MKTYHWNGEYWYRRNWSLFHHICSWIIWVGGWEKANGNGWKIVYRDRREKLRVASPTPIALLGHRLVLYGRWLDVRIGKRILVLMWGGEKKIYLSPDGTPDRANSWWLGAPYEVIMQAKQDM